MKIFAYFLPILAGYLFGSLPFGFLIAKFNGIDIRDYGSGNPGATNVTRVVGKDWGMLCFFLDFLKGFFGAVVGGMVAEAAGLNLEHGRLIGAAMSVCGHNYPVWLGFRGGKGVATTIGALVAIAWLPLLLGLLVWVGTFKLSRYVSMASIATAISIPLSYVLLGKPIFTFTFLLLLTLGSLIVIRHKANIIRLMQGTEHRFEKKKKS